MRSVAVFLIPLFVTVNADCAKCGDPCDNSGACGPDASCLGFGYCSTCCADDNYCATHIGNGWTCVPDAMCNIAGGYSCKGPFSNTTTTTTTAVHETSTPAPTTASGCVDKVDNCRSMIKLCNDPSYRQLMETNCGKTCGFCETCADDPSEDCSANAYLCWNSLYENFMCTVCPLTCACCVNAGVCVDTANNCAQSAYLCYNATYEPLMKEVCNATCHFC